MSKIRASSTPVMPRKISVIAIAEHACELRNSRFYVQDRVTLAVRLVKGAMSLTIGNNIMKRRRKPDFLLLLAIIVGIGVIITMRVQAGADAHLTHKGVSSGSVAVIQTR